jgi:tetratricopeptide (TPR) repeat protein
MCARLVLFWLLLATACAPTRATPATALLASGDDAWLRRFDNAGALEYYLQAVRLEPENAEALWRTSRVMGDLFEQAPRKTAAERRTRSDWLQSSVSFAQRAVTAQPGNVGALLARAISGGRAAEEKGARFSIALAKQIKLDCDAAIALEPNSDEALYVLGRLHATISEEATPLRWAVGLGWATEEKAIALLSSAVDLCPECIRYRLDLAKALAKGGRLAAALKQFDAIEMMPSLSLEDNAFKREASALRASTCAEVGKVAQVSSRPGRTAR